MRDFCYAPGPRLEADGPDSGEKFRQQVLLPQFEQAQSKGRRLVIILDGTAGYASSFLEEAFGGLVRKVREKGLTADDVERIIELRSDTRPWYPPEIMEYIAEA